jgi:hypothetical protein
MLWFMAPVPIVKVDPILTDGARTIFDLTVSGMAINVVGWNTLFVSVDGVWQEPGVAYTANGDKIAFAEAPGTNSMVFMVWFTPEATEDE